MSDQTQETKTESDDESEENQNSLTKAKLLLISLLARIKATVDQSISEIAPQLSGALSGVRIPAGAIKPLALAGVLVLSAVAFPAAPFGGGMDGLNGTTSDPVVGQTYEELGDSDFRQVVTSRVGSSQAEAPPAPSEIRTSAGSQTMQIETTVRDGDPAIVLEDDRTHDGRWVSIDTSWFEEHVGDVPSEAQIDHETDGSYSTPIEVRGESAAFYVQGFSTNTVTFDGELSVSADPAVDGDVISYDAPNGGENLEVDLTGTLSSQNSTQSFSDLSSGDNISVDIGGTTSPLSQLTVDGSIYTSAVGLDAGGYSQQDIFGHEYSGSTGNYVTVNSQIRSTSHPDTIDELMIDISEIGGDTVSVDIYVSDDYNSGESNIAPDGSDTLVKSGWTPDQTTGNQTVNLDNSYNASGNSELALKFETTSDPDGDSDAEWYVTEGDDSGQTSAEIIDSEGNDYVSTTRALGVYYPDKTDLTVSGDDGSSVELTDLDNGETRQTELDLSTSTSQLDFDSTNGGSFSGELVITERSETVDPSISFNGNSIGYNGTLSDGETTSLSVNDSWIQDGTNDVSVSLGSVSSGPEPKVGVDVRHDIAESKTIDYSAEAFSERYTTSKTWNENTSNATLTIPWASSNVIAVRDVNVEYSEGGTELTAHPTPSYSLEGDELLVDLGDVESGWNTTVTADGSKVQVSGADLEVVEPTDLGEDLDSKIKLNNPSDDVYLRVGSTEQGQQLHYLDNSSWSNEEVSQISADGTNEMRIPNAPDNGEAQIRTLPLAFDVGSGDIDVDIPDDRVNDQEPVYRIGPGSGSGDSYDVTFIEAADSQDYVLWDETDEIVLDSGTASSPLTLSTTDPDSSHIIQFQEDDGSATSSGGSGSFGGAAPMVTTSSPFSGLSGLLPGRTTVLFALAGLVGLGAVARTTSLFNEGTRSDAVADATVDVGKRAGGLIERAFDNEIVLAALTLGGGVWLLTSGAFTASERLIISLGTVPIAMFLILQQFDQFDIRIWIGSTTLVGVLGLQQLAPEVFTTVADEAGIIIAVGVIALGWRAISAYRAEASTPDTVNRLEIDAGESDD